MTEAPITLNHVACQIRQVDVILAAAPCDRCGALARRVDIARRTAIDIALDHPIVLLVRVGVHRCAACRHYFRAQPPLLRRDAIYTQRVVRKAVDAVYADGMAFRRVGDRLARDFWVRPSEAMIRRWCRAYGEVAADESYDAWVTAEFSGILCVDEVYQRDLALLLAVDPAAPDGDRLVGYQLVHGPVDASSVAGFLTRLAAAGIEPEQVISDGSPLYPAVLAQVWPYAAHQLCLFHETRRITRAVRSVIERVRRAVPAPPRSAPRRQSGPLHPRPADASRPARLTQPQYERQLARHQAIMRAQALARQGFSQRAIGRQVGATHSTVQRWLAAAAGPPPPPPEPTAPPPWVSCPVLPEERLHTLKEQGLSFTAIACETGLPRATVARWLRDQASPGAVQGPQARLPRAGPCAAESTTVVGPPEPPQPWTSWEQVRQVREALQAHRYLLLRRREHLTAEQQGHVEALLASPLGPTLALARAFLLDWYAIWRTDDGQRRPLEEARARYAAWRTDAGYGTLAPLRRVQAQASDEHFGRVSPFLRDPRWEATNNGAERMGRAFRHQQAPHFNVRSPTSIDRAVAMAARQRKVAATMGPPPVAACRRGRAVLVPAVSAMAA